MMERVSLKGRVVCVVLLLLAASCSPVDACRGTCDGCCDARGGCRGNQAWACGKGGDLCDACEPGQRCEAGACQGMSRADRLSIAGTNAFVPRSAQAFRVTGGDPRVRNFIAVSTISREKCRDPYAVPPEGEQVLMFSEPNGTVDPIALLTPSDGGVRHEGLNGTQGMAFGVDFARVDFNIANARVVLNGTIEAPYCGEY